MSCSLFVCEVFSSENILSLKIIYRSSTGRLGFESDTLGSDILRFLLKDSATWDFRKNSVRVFDEHVYSDPFSFLSGIRPTDRFTRLLTFQKQEGIDEILIEKVSNISVDDDHIFLEAAESATEKGYFLTQTNFNDFSITVFINPKSTFTEELKKKVASINLSINVVNKEEMPAW